MRPPRDERADEAGTGTCVRIPLAAIRELSMQDTRAYRELMARGFGEHPTNFRICAEDAGEPLVPFAAAAQDDFTLGAFLSDGTLAGALSFQRETRTKLQHKGLFYRMYVSADASGKGIGRKLVRAAIARAATIVGLEQINLTVVAHNERAKRLYTSEGFETFAFEKRSIKHGALYLDEEQMTLRLSAP